MTSLGSLLKQIKEKEEHDLAFAKKIKKVEALLKSEQETLKKLKSKQKILSEEIKRKYFRCSSSEIKKVELLYQKQIWEDLLQESQGDLSQSEANLDELQESVCFSRISYCNELKVYLDKHALFNPCEGDNYKPCLPVLPDSLIKIEQDEENLEEELSFLENQLEELKTEKSQIENAKAIKVKLEAEPICGVEFLRYQHKLKVAKDNLKQAEEEETCLKIDIAQKEVLLLKNRSLKTDEQIGATTVFEKKLNDNSFPIKTLEVVKRTSVQELPTSKTVTFNSTVKMKTISPPLQNKVVLKSKNRTKTPSAALRKKLAQQLTSHLDETMRNILFKDKIE